MLLPRDSETCEVKEPELAITCFPLIYTFAPGSTVPLTVSCFADVLSGMLSTARLGAELSFVTTSCFVALLPAASVTVTIILLTPSSSSCSYWNVPSVLIGTTLPFTERVSGPTSVRVSTLPVSFTPESLVSLSLEETVKDGGVVSYTTRTSRVLLFPLSSLATRLIILMPSVRLRLTVKLPSSPSTTSWPLTDR